MASPRRKRSPVASRRITAAPTSPKNLATTSPPNLGRFLPAIEELLAGDGQISIGTIEPIPCAAIASDGHNMLAALVRRSDETLQQLLERLDQAVQLAMDDEIYTDEINTPIGSSRR